MPVPALGLLIAPYVQCLVDRSKGATQAGGLQWLQPPSSIAITAVYLEVVRFTDLYNTGMAGMLGIHESVYGDIKNSDMHQPFLDLWNDVRYHFGMHCEAQFEITDSFPSDEHTPEEHDHLRNVISVCTANARSTQRIQRCGQETSSDESPSTSVWYWS